MGVAYADPDLILVEAEGRAGDIVHFSITGAKGPVTYELEIGHHDLVENATGAGSVVMGEFALPHLGDSSRTVTVKAEIREPGDKTTVKRKFKYLGPVPAATHPTHPVSAPAPATQPPTVLPPSAQPVAVPQALPPDPAPATHTAAAPASRATVAPRRSRYGGKRGKAKARRHTPSSSSSSSSRKGKPGRDSPRRKTRSKRPGPRTAPLFDGVPEPGAGNSETTKEDGHASRNAPPAAVLAGTRAASSEDSVLSAAVLVPGLMGVAALVLTGATLHRRRRLR